MKTIYNYILGIFVALIVIIVVSLHQPQSRITIYSGDSLTLSPECSKVGFLGCTPHPSRYLQSQEHPLQALQILKLATIIDVDDLQDSFDKTIELCTHHDIDHLIIAYLPIYCVDMRPLLHHQFVDGCMLFFKRIHTEIIPLIQKAIQKYDYTGIISLILPSQKTITQVPYKINSMEDRIRYLIKEFPKFSNLNQSNLETIAIINNKESQEDDQLINYLKYEYLYQKPVTYEKYTTNKERFHSYK